MDGHADHPNPARMNVLKRIPILISIVAFFAAIVAAAIYAPRPGGYAVIRGFPMAGQEGTTPMGLTIDDADNLYGTTWTGGNATRGTIFKLTPPPLFKSAWGMQILSNMNIKTTGEGPFWSMMNRNGELYGATTDGGMHGAGTLFKLQPGEHGWSEPMPLLHFAARGFGDKIWELISDASGSLYGTTEGRGGPDGGTVFKLSPSQDGWTMTILHRFKGGDDGAYPHAGLVIDRSGALYGTTGGGGKSGIGTVFKLTPTEHGWDETVIHTFRSVVDGSNYGGGALPMAGLTLDADGTLYGTAGGGGKFDRGVVFSLTPSASGGWTQRVLYSFTRESGEGSAPNSRLVLGSSGELYGTTKFGGVEPNGKGTVFKLVPTWTGWNETVLHRFAGGADGAFPTGTLLRGKSGRLFGLTSGGGIDNGVYNDGTVYQIVP